MLNPPRRDAIAGFFIIGKKTQYKSQPVNEIIIALYIAIRNTSGNHRK